MKLKNPLYADFLVTPRCNFNCSFCSASATKGKGEIKELSLSVIENTFKQLDDLEVLRVSIEGGEPFLRDDIIEIIQIADMMDFEYYVNTNGSLITNSIASSLSKTKIPQICMSIDGPNNVIHDASRGYPGSFELMKRAVRELHSKGIKVQAIITLSSINLDYFYETMHFIKSLGINSASVMILATVGNALNGIGVDYHKWSKLLVRLSKDKSIGNLPIDIRLVPAGESLHPWELYLPLKESNNLNLMNQWIPENSVSLIDNNSFGCTACRESLAIDGFGNVYGCSLMVSNKELSGGNILDKTLNDIWYNSDVFNNLRGAKLKDIEGPCVKCDNLNLCKGGCRACSHASSKKINGSDLRCPLTKEK